MGLSFEVGIIGAGIQGAGVAQAAAAAGYRVVVWEQTAVAAGTSSRSSKLIHGGLRYLESGQIALVRMSLLERARLLKNAPTLVKPVPFYIPIYPDTQRRPWQIRLGLSLYALLGNLHRYARFQKIQGSYLADKDGLRTTQLQKLYQYWDAQTDDVALTRAVMRSAEHLGASLQCPAQVLSITEGAQGYTVRVEQSGTTQTYTCRTLVNAAGPWVNQVLARVTPPPRTLAMDRVQGAHIVVDAPAPSGIYYVEAPQDRRAVFVMPWQGMTLIGTTETPFVDGDPASVQPRQEEIDYLLQVYAHYFPERGGALRESFAGLRVLPKQAGDFFNRPRDTVIHADPSQPGLLTLYGGKLTGYRATAEAVMKRLQAHLPRRKKGVDVRSLELR